MGTCVVRRLHAADLILLACVGVWGFNVAVTKYAFGHGFSPLSFAPPPSPQMELGLEEMMAEEMPAMDH